MAGRQERLRKLVEVQERLKAMHEMRHAMHLAAAAAAAGEAEELAAHAAEPGLTSALFPDLYARRIDRALKRQAESLELARREAAHVATAAARTTMVEGQWRRARQADERQAQERETLEAVERKIAADPDK